MLSYGMLLRDKIASFDLVNNKRDKWQQVDVFINATAMLARRMAHAMPYPRGCSWAHVFLLFLFFSALAHLDNTFKLRLVGHSAVLYYYSFSLTLQLSFCTNITPCLNVLPLWKGRPARRISLARLISTISRASLSKRSMSAPVSGSLTMYVSCVFPGASLQVGVVKEEFKAD